MEGRVIVPISQMRNMRPRERRHPGFGLAHKEAQLRHCLLIWALGMASGPLMAQDRDLMTDACLLSKL